METVKVLIEVPKPPDGYEVVGPGWTSIDSLWLFSGKWLKGHDVYYSGCIAKRKQTLAEWMNAQPDFQVVAKMFPQIEVNSINCNWQVNRGWPRPPVSGTVKSNGEKWIDL